MRQALLLATALAGACPVMAQTAADILRAGQAAEVAAKAQMEAEERARQEALDNTLVWTCTCVGGYPVFSLKTIRQVRAEGKAINQRSQALYAASPQMSAPLNMMLANPCK